LLQLALVPLIIGAGFLTQPSSIYRIESVSLPNGADLVTVYGRLHDETDSQASGEQTQPEEFPVLAILRDTLGDTDPAQDRLRQVWILTSARPTPFQRAASALSFGFLRAGSRRHARGAPRAALDLAAPYRNVYGNVFSDGLQVLEFDPLGMAIRSTTRTYRGNSSDYSKLQVYQALATLDHLSRGEESVAALPDAQFREVYSRLSLSTHAFGGLVRQQKLSHYYDRHTSQVEETRGHNWELLRQRAERNGLIFDPLTFEPTTSDSRTPSEALLWISRSDLRERTSLSSAAAKEAFDGQFLGIANPWIDERLLHWTGYTQVRYFDSDHQQATASAPGARAEELIPLALYSLDYPRVPLLLADFRDAHKAKRRELMNQGASSLATGVFGLSRFASPEFFAASALWTFVRGRHGAAVNRSARLEAYSEAREFVSMDESLEPALKLELQRHLGQLALNPRENDIADEARLAREQYAALLAYLQSPRGEAKLERDRKKELEAYTQSPARRFGNSLARLFTHGPHVDAERPKSALSTSLAAYRRSAYHKDFLSEILTASPRPDVNWDPHLISQSVLELSEDKTRDPETKNLISQVCSRSTEGELRLTCVQALEPRPAPAEAVAVSGVIAGGQ